MTAKSRLICLQNIVTYHDQKPKDINTAQRTIKAVNSKKDRVIALVAEETEEGKIILIENFKYFSALKKIDPYLRGPFLVYPGTSKRQRIIHILKVSIPLEKDINWTFYNWHINTLMIEHGMSIEEIAVNVNCDTAKIKYYTWDKRIPYHIIEKAMKMDARTTVQSICSNKVIPEELKLILFEKAVLGHKHVYRLTSEKLKHIKMLCQKHIIPVSLLDNKLELEHFINELLANNFYLDDHFDTLTPTDNQLKSKQWSLLTVRYGLSSKKTDDVEMQ